MKVKLDYDKKSLTVEIPQKNLIKIFRMRDSPLLSHPFHILKEKALHPINSSGLDKLASDSKTACLVISDKTRPVPNKLILPPLLNILENSGIKRENITLLIATGLHSPTEGKDLLEFLGEKIIRNYRIINHQARNEKNHVFLGETKKGTPIFVNKVYHHSHLRILTGLIEPHFMTGFSGGRKSICPGIVSWKTIKVHHSPEFLESPFSRPGILEGNPCHEEALEIAKKAGVDFIVNITLNKEKQVTGIFAGGLESAWLSGVKFCQEQGSDFLEEEVDLVITSGGGYPLDCNFYQTVKGLVGALEIVKKGGIIIIASGCRDGIGSLHFKKLLQEMKSPQKFLEMIKGQNYFSPDQWEVEELVKVLKKAKVKIYSAGLREKEIEKPWLSLIPSVERGIEEALKEYGQKMKIAVVPQGPYLLAKLKGRKKNV